MQPRTLWVKRNVGMGTPTKIFSYHIYLDTITIMWWIF
nr:MAG TPA: hypothetical protein [Caudoviricetes sp.]DAY92726.1 MAG TPA: hypothetical protein [Caudoviricetes sp.]